MQLLIGRTAVNSSANAPAATSFQSNIVLVETSLDRLRLTEVCRLIYPRMLPLKDLDLETARTILADRKLVCPFIPNIEVAPRSGVLGHFDLSRELLL